MSEPAPDPATTSTRRRPSRAWYIAAFVPFLLSLIPAYFLGEAAADKVAVELTQLTGRTVDLESSDRSIYATSRQLSEQARCTLRSVTGASIPLDTSVSHLSTEQDGRTWYRVARLPDTVDTGTYLLRCSAVGGGVDPTSFAVSSAPRWGQFALLLIAAFGVPVAAAVLGLLIVVAIVVLRRRAEREERSLSAIQLE
ncbi:MAG TPA: hypothetical protein VFR22_18495 [Nocardioidaceae bacterium]|nr:hypothetical protein [Nocardioidaceae bacterium]